MCRDIKCCQSLGERKRGEIEYCTNNSRNTHKNESKVIYDSISICLRESKYLFDSISSYVVLPLLIRSTFIWQDILQKQQFMSLDCANQVKIQVLRLFPDGMV